MITIVDKHNCCGCGSCEQRCPRHCITMLQDDEGFLYPDVNTASCVNCGLCESVCPILAHKRGNDPLKVLASRNTNDGTRLESSSGGVFTILAESVIQNGGVVFGARWSKNWSVEHASAETVEDLQAFRSSKYVQSDIGDNYRKAEDYLKEGRNVLFSGTPCQIAGLKAFLHKEYDNLLAVECACHGVPSPGLWRKYIDEVSGGREVTAVNHRDKSTGWRNYSVALRFSDGSKIMQPHDDNPWTRSFIKNLNLRPTCYQCAFKTFNSQADITLADLWGDRVLLPGNDDDKGITLVLVRTSRGSDAISGIDPIKEFSLEEVVPFNGALVIPSGENPRRKEFMERVENGEPFTRVVKSITKDPLVLRVKQFAFRLINRCK